MTTTFADVCAELAEIDAGWKAGTLTPVAHGNRREKALCAAIVLVAADFGVQLKPPSCIDARGEISVVTETGNYGEAFSALLNTHCRPRTGILPTAIMKEWDSWCRVNHFDVERLVRAYAASLAAQANSQKVD